MTAATVGLGGGIQGRVRAFKDAWLRWWRGWPSPLLAHQPTSNARDNLLPPRGPPWLHAHEALGSRPRAGASCCNAVAPRPRLLLPAPTPPSRLVSLGRRPPPAPLTALVEIVRKSRPTARRSTEKPFGAMERHISRHSHSSLCRSYWAFEHSGLNFDQRLGFCLRSQRRASVFLSHTR